MKSREGTVVDADALMAEMVNTAKAVSSELGKLDGCDEAEIAEITETVGLGALKYFLLKVDPRKNMTFNPKESIDFNGNTGPFIQYTYARIRSVLRKAEDAGMEIGGFTGVKPGEKEITLIQRLADFPTVVQEAGRTYSPALIANYAYDLVKEYNQFYHDCSILKEENEAVRSMRLTLSAVTADTIRTAMSLLGIKVPERM
ncbi:MAG: arginine--tRNA ligase, partial [Paramuribaculum sp.]|nr:arginine--tRNA ligase [Paramuribaculum sp.]